MKIEVVGRWQTGSYTNKDGNKVRTDECIVEKQEFGQSKSESQREERNTQSAPEPTPSGYDGFMDVDLSSDELPFS